MKLELSTASRQQLLTFLRASLTCPVDIARYDLPPDFAQLILERWSHTIEDHLPEWDRDLLCDNVGEYPLFLAEPETEDNWWELTDDDELRALAYNTFGFHETYRADFLAKVGRILAIRAQTQTERDKHYVPASSSSSEVRSRSLSTIGVGLLLPFMSPSLQRRLIWHALSQLFERRRSHHVSSDDGHVEFEATWSEVFGVHQRRISVDTLDVVGYFAGAEARWLIFDIHFDAAIFHCYPSINPIDEEWATEVDGLEGAKQAFDAKKPLDWLQQI